MNHQYTQNIKDAQSWRDSSDAAMSDTSSVLIRAQELAVKAGGANNETSYKAIAVEIDGIINHLVQVGNTQVGDRYIFAGQKDKTQPLERITDPLSGKDMVVYKGDLNKISMPVQPGAANPEQDSVNETGEQVFGPIVQNGGNQTLDVFNHLIALKEELQKASPDQSWISNTALANINSDHTRVLATQTIVGERMSQYEMTANMMSKAETTINADIAANEDIDLARAIIDFKTSENVYNSALAVGARILPQSLVDFLR
jgi:flagellar hook-associated protein 3 FlgL